MILNALSLKDTDIGYSILHANEYGYLIRATSRELKSLSYFV